MGSKKHRSARTTGSSIPAVDFPAFKSTPLKDLLMVIQDTICMLDGAIRIAAEAWLTVVEKLPKTPCDVLTAASVHFVEQALRQSVRMESLAWARKYVPGVNATIGVHLEKQLTFTLKRLQIVEQLCTSQRQTPCSQIMLSMKRECMAVMQAQFIVRVISPVAAMAMVLQDVEHAIAGSALKGKDGRQDQLSLESDLADKYMSRIGDGVAMAYAWKQCLQISAWLHTVDDIPVDEKEFELSGRQIGRASYRSSEVWFFAAFRFPETHKLSAMLLLLVTWSDIMEMAEDASGKARIAPLVARLWERKDLLNHVWKGAGHLFWADLVKAFLPSWVPGPASQLPQATSQELLGCGEEPTVTSSKGAAAAHSPHEGGSSSNMKHVSEDVHACVPSTSTHSAQDAAAGVATGTGSELNDMQELLQMMYGLSELGKSQGLVDGAQSF